MILLTNRIRQQALRMSMRILDQTKLSTAVSELARNVLIHGGGRQRTTQRRPPGIARGHPADVHRPETGHCRH